MASPKFELYEDAEGKFRFRLKAENGEIIADSQGYTTKSGALRGIESVKNNAIYADVVDLGKQNS